MVLVISQETFDNAVQENINDLGMEPREALQEAVTQFEKQGVDLSNILKELKLSENDNKKIEDLVKKLVQLNKTQGKEEAVIETLEAIKSECDKGIPNRMAVAKAGAYNVLLGTIRKYKSHQFIELLKHCLRAVIALMTKQPDLLDDEGIKVILDLLHSNLDIDSNKLTLRWIKECCVLHEYNRQRFMENNIVESIKKLLNIEDPRLLRDTLLICRTLVLDDDIRVEFGKAHEHARIISSEILCQLTSLLNRLQFELDIINDILLTMSTLLVRTEFCKKVQDAGGIEVIKDIMNRYMSEERVIKQCFKLLKALAGNDDCKNYILQKKLAPTIVNAISSNEKSPGTVVAGFLCISAFTLRSPANSEAIYEAGGPEAIVKVMKLHQEEKQVQKTASWAIRNMVSRSRYQNEKFLELGVEEILQADLKKYKEIEYDIKAALRDLGCKVNLKEEWTGKGGALTTGQTNEEDE